MSELITAFPVCWPTGYKKTLPQYRKDSQFRQTPGAVQDELRRQLDMLSASQVIISTNAPIKRDGSLYSNTMKLKNEPDPSVAVYFQYQGNQTVLCCDQYNTIWENMYAIARTIENMRAIERWGVSDFIKRSFTGFQELPPSTGKKDDAKPWWEIFELNKLPPFGAIDIVKSQYRVLSKKYHPDGTKPNNEKMQELNNAWEQAQKYFGK